jgi:hypothetical protein
MPKHSAESLGALERKELQHIAKELGLKQNAKSAELISQILAKQPSTPAKAATPAKASATPKAAPSAAAKAATPKAASTKKAPKQAKATKRDASPAPQSAQKSSKRQRLEDSPAPAAAKAATPKASAKKTPKGSAKKTPKAGSAKKSVTPKTKATPKATSSKKSASKSVKKGGIAKTKTPGKKTTVTGITEEALELLRLTAKCPPPQHLQQCPSTSRRTHPSHAYRVIPAAADAALGADVHSAAAASKNRAGGGRGSFAAKFAKIHEKVVFTRCAKCCFKLCNACKELCEDEARYCQVCQGSEGSEGEQGLRLHCSPPRDQAGVQAVQRCVHWRCHSQAAVCAQSRPPARLRQPGQVRLLNRCLQEAGVLSRKLHFTSQC